MIPRYCRPELARVWSDRTRFTLWLEVELAHLEAREAIGDAPVGTVDAIRAAVAQNPLDPAKISEIENVTHHDVIAFLTHVESIAGPHARLLHLGLTSSDVLDTAFALQLVMATDHILASTDALLAALRARAVEHRHTPMIGRSHGIHAEFTTFGLALLSLWSEITRGRQALERAREDVAVGKLSGAVGTFAATLPSVEVAALESLGLQADPVSTQVVSRDRHARYFSTLACLAASVERAAVSVRHWQRTEVGEAAEPFGSGQRGSSAMPHKKNPVLSENVTGLARLVRSYASAALEDVALWHERDISHSSVERVIGPDATAATDFMIRRMARVFEGLNVYPERMMDNLALTRGLPFSGLILTGLVEAGLDRQHAYAIVQRLAFAAVEGGPSVDFKSVVMADPVVQKLLPEAAIEGCFELATALRHVDAIFERTLGGPSA